jgi:hypothetical protein
VSMQTRRQLLQQALILPLAAGLSGLEIVTEPNCLSAESAAGFRSLGVPAFSKMILLCGVSSVRFSSALRLRERAGAGSWVIWESSPYICESQARIIGDVFGIRIAAPILASMGNYIQYRWPYVALTRTFSAVIPVSCSERETIAFYGDTPVAMRRAIGGGGLVFLGSMLGPNLHAEEREARAIGTELLRFRNRFAR